MLNDSSGFSSRVRQLLLTWRIARWAAGRSIFAIPPFAWTAEEMSP